MTKKSTIDQRGKMGVVCILPNQEHTAKLGCLLLKKTYAKLHAALDGGQAGEVIEDLRVCSLYLSLSVIRDDSDRHSYQEVSQTSKAY